MDCVLDFTFRFYFVLFSFLRLMFSFSIEDLYFKTAVMIFYDLKFELKCYVIGQFEY